MFRELKLPKFKVPVFCLATGCVSRHRGWTLASEHPLSRSSYFQNQPPLNAMRKKVTPTSRRPILASSLASACLKLCSASRRSGNPPKVWVHIYKRPYQLWQSAKKVPRNPILELPITSLRVAVQLTRFHCGFDSLMLATFARIL